ncbi:hypothetical protein Q9L58_003663 [Maublancomyces gigas]|uniref:Uncharacterized protein n=1 Tax=Discina gigas TaxID=1032678 RepID=A0ABR3GNF2_9PEZI
MSLTAPRSSRHRRSVSSFQHEMRRVEEDEQFQHERRRAEEDEQFQHERRRAEEDEQFQRKRRRAEEDERFERERRRELQFTLDKLEGRIRVNADGRFERIGPDDRIPNNMFGLMSLLGNTNSGAGEPTAEDNRLEDHLNNGMANNRAAGPVGGSDPGRGGFDYGGPSYNDNFESGGVKSMVTGGVTAGSSGNITHPGFSWHPDSDESWETSSRVSEDSFFDEHTRHPPEPKTSSTRRAIERFSPLGAATISPYEDYLRTKLLPKIPTDNSSIDQVGESSQSHEPGALSYISPFDPRSTALTQTGIVLQGKPSLMKRIIGVVAQPMKRLTSRNKKTTPVNIGNERPETPTDGNSSIMRSGNHEAASSYPSGSSSKGTGKKVVFNDTVGYRVFNEDSLCAEDN